MSLEFFILIGQSRHSNVHYAIHESESDENYEKHVTDPNPYP